MRLNTTNIRNTRETNQTCQKETLTHSSPSVPLVAVYCGWMSRWLSLTTCLRQAAEVNVHKWHWAVTTVSDQSIAEFGIVLQFSCLSFRMTTFFKFLRMQILNFTSISFIGACVQPITAQRPTESSYRHVLYRIERQASRYGSDRKIEFHSFTACYGAIEKRTKCKIPLSFEKP